MADRRLEWAPAVEREPRPTEQRPEQGRDLHAPDIRRKGAAALRARAISFRRQAQEREPVRQEPPENWR